MRTCSAPRNHFPTAFPLSDVGRERATALRWQPPAPREPLPAPLGPLGPPLVGLETAGGSSNDTSRGAMWLPRLPQTPPLVWISFPSACHEPVELHNPSVTWDTAACYNTCGSTRPSTWLSFVGENLILETGFLVSADLSAYDWCLTAVTSKVKLIARVSRLGCWSWLMILATQQTKSNICKIIDQSQIAIWEIEGKIPWKIAMPQPPEIFLLGLALANSCPCIWRIRAWTEDGLRKL